MSQKEKPSAQHPGALEAQRLLRQMIDMLDVSELTDKGREVIASSWVMTEREQPRTGPVGGGWMAMVQIIDPGEMEPKLFLCVHTAKAVALGVQMNVPGAELLAEDLLRRCGFEDARIQELLGEMVARAPEPDPQEVN